LQQYLPGRDILSIGRTHLLLILFAHLQVEVC
jgi:hypothetical protein